MDDSLQIKYVPTYLRVYYKGTYIILLKYRLGLNTLFLFVCFLEIQEYLPDWECILGFSY